MKLWTTHILLYAKPTVQKACKTCIYHKMDSWLHCCIESHSKDKVNVLKSLNVARFCSGNSRLERRLCGVDRRHDAMATVTDCSTTEETETCGITSLMYWQFKTRFRDHVSEIKEQVSAFSSEDFHTISADIWNLFFERPKGSAYRYLSVSVVINVTFTSILLKIKLQPVSVLNCYTGTVRHVREGGL